jgi:hypothetical protein
MIRDIVTLTTLLGFVIFTYLIIDPTNSFESQPSPPDQKFEVVDTYGGCDVVRYNPDYSAHYTYLLHCNK